MRSSLWIAVVAAVAAAAGCGGTNAGGTDGGGDDGGPDAGGPDADVPPDGPPIASCPAGTYCVETAPIPATTLLYAVHAVDASDVFAVGDGGTIIRRHAGAWAAMPSGTTQDLRGVWAISSTNVWAVGAAGTVLHYQGAAWAAVGGVTTGDLNGVWASGDSDVWAVSPGEIHHWNGAAWTTTPTTGTLFAVTGTGPSDVWISGENAKAKHFDGTAWTTVDPGIGLDVYTIKAVTSTRVWAAGLTTGKETASYTGASWVSHGTSGTVFQALHAFGADDVWGAGGTKVGHWNGTTWASEAPNGNTHSLWGISGAGGELFIVGSGATILHRD